MASPVGVVLLVCGIALSVGVSLLVAARDADRQEARVAGELRYATAALATGLQSTQALLFALDAPLGRSQTSSAGPIRSRLRRVDLRRLEPSLRAVVRYEPTGGARGEASAAGAKLTRVLPAGLAPSLRMLPPPAEEAVASTLRRALGRGNVALSRPVDTSLGRVLVAALAVRPVERAEGAAGERHWVAAVLGLDAFVAAALNGIDRDVAVRIRALRDAGAPAPVAAYSPSGPIDAEVFEDAPSDTVRVGDRTWDVRAVATGEPPLLSLPILLVGLALTGLVVALLATARLAERRARTLAALMTTGLRERTRQMETLTENAPDLIGRFDREGRLIFANTALREVTGMTIGETLRAATEQGSDTAPVATAIRRPIERTLLTGERRQAEFSLPVGEATRDFEVNLVPELDDAGRVEHVLAIARDVTERVRAQREMAGRALRDPLTGLANRALVYDRLEQALARRSGGPVAVLVIDMDRFKLVNDSFGHAVGDRLLTEVGERLTPLLREEDTLGRLGGDEFVVVAEMGERADAVRLAERIVEALRPPLVLGSRRLSVTASVGLVAREDHEDGAHDLVRAADAAMYEAKSRGGDAFAVYDESMRVHARDRLVLEHGIRAGLQRDEFVAHFQPLVRSSDRRVIGFEALARWHRPGGGLATPQEFIDAAEESGLIADLGAAIIRQAARQATAWNARERGIRIWVNLSARQLMRPDFLDGILALLDEEDAPYDALGFELTETTMAHGPQHVRHALGELRRRGSHIAIDDFGIGYSSLSRIKELPIDEIKIDRSFIAGVGHDPNDTALVEAVVRLARAREASTVAEGIETEEQAERLAGLGCDTLQGYLFGRPAPVAEIRLPAAAGAADRA